ncbi:hypothetical protein [Hymenobacter cellulosilyticus]|uniref:Uncharacterized protein n=1 Tax=Hymenobacter cellulosilyticus TaxID=2932248 RepID=A0A8T9Q4E4_9BACT|nr:hypothetical protein [Hymenobacter cellulosilyticus]UOQ69983.1 hypothetical protein MUN79_14400 [Hymenobacter cellulosilyticus]
MANKILPPNITPADYRDATLNWVQTIERPTSEAYKIFEVDSTQLTAVSFPLEAIISLLSTVRVHYIEARFLVVNDRFSIGLYATDVNHVRLSGYYQAYSWWTTPIMGAPAKSFTGTDQAPTPWLAPGLRPGRTCHRLS